MGLTPSDVRAMTWAEFFAFFDGFTKSQGKPDEVSDDEFAKALAEEQVKGRA